MRECQQIIQVSSRTETGIVEKELSEFIWELLDRLGKKAEFVLYTHNKVVIGKVWDNQLFPQKDFGERYFKEIRIFNKRAELHIWRYNERLYYRLRIDGEDELENIYEEEHIIWGTDIEKKEKSIINTVNQLNKYDTVLFGGGGLIHSYRPDLGKWNKSGTMWNISLSDLQSIKSKIMGLKFLLLSITIVFVSKISKIYKETL